MKNLKFIEWSIKHKDIIEKLNEEELEIISDLDKYVDDPSYVENHGLPSLNYTYQHIGIKGKIQYTLKYSKTGHKLFTHRKVNTEELLKELLKKFKGDIHEKYKF